MKLNSRIHIDPSVCHGKPVVQGTRVLVSTILGALSAGDTLDQIQADYPSLTMEDIFAALEFASHLSDFQQSAYGTAA